MAAATAAAAGVAASFSLSGFDAAAPQAFYLWEQAEDMEAMADACLIVEGTRLPVHTQVLSLACGVLRRMFADLRSAAAGGAGDGGTPSRKRKADDGGQELTIEAPFVGFSVRDVAVFLRLLYDQRWQAVAADTFAQLDGSLSAAVRLAHRLEAQQLLSPLCSYMSGCTSATTSQLVVWLEAAETCQLDELRSSCLLLLARKIADWGTDVARDLTHATGVERCSPRTLSQLLAIVAAAGARQRMPRQPLVAMLPSATSLGRAMAAAANSGQLEWTVRAFSTLPAAAGDHVDSPKFTAAGHTWQLHVYPGAVEGGGQDPQRFLGVFLSCRLRGKDVCGRFALELLDGNGMPRITQVCRDKEFRNARGWHNLLSREQAAQLNLLAGDCLRLRVTVTVAA